MTYRKIQCLFCNRITFGSGFDTEYCHVCYHKYIKQLEAKLENSKQYAGGLEKALRENIYYCCVIEEGKACLEIATWNVSDYTWDEYLCDKHKNASLCKEKPRLVPILVRAKAALKGEVNGN